MKTVLTKVNNFLARKTINLYDILFCSFSFYLMAKTDKFYIFIPLIYAVAFLKADLEDKSSV